MRARFAGTATAIVLASMLMAGCGPKEHDPYLGFPAESASPPADSNPAKAQPTDVDKQRPCGPKLLKQSGESWQCTFADNFQGTRLDPKKWVVLTSALTGLGGPDDCYFDDGKNVRVTHGQLTLSVRKLAQPRPCKQAGGEARYTGAMLNTIHRFSQLRGRFEFRARFPETKAGSRSRPGIQGSLWMWPIDDTKYGPWPSSGEIDVAEFYSSYPDRIIPFLHYDRETSPELVSHLEAKPEETNNECRFAAPDGDFHTYTLEWTQRWMHIFYDGKTCMKTPWLATQGGRAPFDQPFMLAIGFGTGKFDNAVTDQTPTPVHLDIDYVRVWR